MRHDIREIVNGTIAKLSHIHNGVATYIIAVKGTFYQWDFVLGDPRFFNHYFMVEFRPVEYMAWLRQDLLDLGANGRFKQLN